MKMPKMPSFIQPLVSELKPAAITGAVVALGAVNAQVGGEALKAVSDDIEAFAARSVWHEAGVDAGGGVILDAACVAGAAAWKGAKLAKSVAGPLLIGTGLSAVAPAVAGQLQELRQKVRELVAPAKAALPAAEAAPAVPPQGGALMSPGGFNLDPVPGGFTMGLFDEVVGFG